ncbi:TIR domain-containing protein [Sphingomonas sp.]|uniref:TIR domain-containing protein n=1 Tax=Sphingomonas sp. TaxID=28214 RepID=UPI001806EDA1|nr:TIR domain-containing protein [Sphingomonas sp.]MBA3511029.1 TIR domain-containing protein [Sphingomonas sp.]
MADVFLSYARPDRVTAERLAGAIADTGLTVWWDRHIKGGSDFSRDIEKQLNAASKVLVMWSKEAADSRWVRDEASVAADSGRLVAVTIDGTPPPLGFRQFQTIDLKKWAAKGAPIPPALAEALEVEKSAPAERSVSRPPRRLIAAGIGALLLAGAATLAIVRPEPIDRLISGQKQGEGVSLAIMPFVTSGDRGIEYLGAGLSSALADSLTPLSGLRITSSTSTHALAGKSLTAPEIAQRLGITHLVEGNVQKLGERLSISVRLIDAKSSEQVWARTFEGAADELQVLKNRMARELAGGLRAGLGAGEGDVAQRRNVDPAAYEAYLRALERVSVRDERDARLEAIKQFRLAASIQPDFADAHAGYAWLMALSMPDQLGMSWSELIAEQRRANERALELDPENNLALVAKSTALNNFSGAVDQALPIDQAVLKRSPNFGPAHYSIAASLWLTGRTREALGHLEQAIERDPFDTLLPFYRVKILYSLGDYGTVRDAAINCRDFCEAIGWYWFSAMAGFATPAQYREDFPVLAKAALAGELSEQEVAEVRGIADRLILGRPFKLPPIPEDARVDFFAAAIAARMRSFDEGLRHARTATERDQADSVLDILNEGRLTFTPEQRADPRYHQLFRHPKLIRIAAARRKQGVTAGLPLFPVKTYGGP